MLDIWNRNQSSRIHKTIWQFVKRGAAKNFIEVFVVDSVVWKKGYKYSNEEIGRENLIGVSQILE